MSNEMNGVDAMRASARKISKRSSTAVKLVQAAALAAVLVPLGSVSVETTTCGFGAYYNVGGSGCALSSPDHQRFFFPNETEGQDPYFFDLTLLGRTGDFFIDIQDNPMTQGEFDLRTDPPVILLSVDAAAVGYPFADYLCVPLVDPTSSSAGACRDFFVTFSDLQAGKGFTGYTFTIDWDYDSENNGFADMGGRITVLHNEGSIAGPNYDEDMCKVFNNCSYSPFPSISSGDTDFQSLAVALDPNGAVPEPATLILLGSGLGGMLYRRRRRKP